MADTSTGRWDWLLASLLLGILASLVRWLLGFLADGHGRGRASGGGPWTAVVQAVESPWISYPVRLIYGIGVPALALFWQGALTARGLGLSAAVGAGSQIAAGDATTGPAWGHDLAGFVVVAAMLALALGIGSLLSAGLEPETRRATSRRWRRRSVGRVALDALYYEAHWAFYREPFVMGWGVGVGSWMGAVLVVLEAAVSPVFWESLHTGQIEFRRRVLVRAGLLVASAQLYLLAQNLWLALAMDILVGWLILPWVDRPAEVGQSVTNEAITTIR